MAFNGGSAGAALGGRSPSPFSQFGRSPSPNPPVNPFGPKPPPAAHNPFSSVSGPSPGNPFGSQPNGINPSSSFQSQTSAAGQTMASSPFSAHSKPAQASPFGHAQPSANHQWLSPGGFGNPSNIGHQQKPNPFGQTASGTGFFSSTGQSQSSPFGQAAPQAHLHVSGGQANVMNGSSRPVNPFAQPSTQDGPGFAGSGAPFSMASNSSNFPPAQSGFRSAPPQVTTSAGSRNGFSSIGDFSSAQQPFGSQAGKGSKWKEGSQNRKPNFTETLEMNGMFVGANGNGSYALNGGKRTRHDLTADASGSQPKPKHHNPFKTLSENQPGPGTSGAGRNPALLSASSRVATLEEYATAIRNQLRKDNIRDLIIPANFGDPANRAKVQAFKENQMSKHRNRVRKSLEDAGLVDKAGVQISLKDAIDFRGVCEDMCSVYEVVVRIAENMDKPEEREEGSDGTLWACREKFVKRLARSSAGAEAPLPTEVRSVPALQRTLNYLLGDLLQGEHNLKDRHGFLWDRLRAVRKDFIFQSRLTPEEIQVKVDVLETIARFHAIAHHLLARKGAAYLEYSDQQEREALKATLMSLKEAYGDCRRAGIEPKNEVEFLSYWVLFFAEEPSTLLQLDKESRQRNWAKSNQFQTAISLVQAFTDFRSKLRSGDRGGFAFLPSLALGESVTFFDIVADPTVSYTMACIAEMHFGGLRHSLLKNVVKACARNRDPPKDITPAVLKELFRFDNEEEAVEFVQDRGLSFSPDGSYLVLDNRNLEIEMKRTPSFSHHLVERKRCNRPLLEVVRQNSFEQDTPSDAPGGKDGNSPEEGMFVDDYPTKSVWGAQQTTVAPMENTSISPIAPPSMLAHNPLALPPTNTAKPSGVLQGVALGIAPGGIPKPFQAFASTKSHFDTATQKHSSMSSSNEPKPNPFANLNAPSKKPATSLKVTPPTPKFPPSPFPTTGAETPVGSTAKVAPAFGSSLSPIPSTLPTSRPASAARASQPSIAAQSGSPEHTTEAPSRVLGQPSKTKQPSALGKTGDPERKQKTVDEDRALAAPPLVSVVPGLLNQPAVLEPANKDLQIKNTPQIPSKPAEPPENVDQMGDFAKWFVLGDGGLLDEFKGAYVEYLLRKAYHQFQEEEHERKRKAEDEKSWEEALAWRRYNLGLKFFYRWRDNARNKALTRRAMQGREMMKAFREAQLAEEKAKRKAAAAKKHADDARRASLLENTASHFVHDLSLVHSGSISRRHNSMSNAEKDLLATGVFSGTRVEREAASDAIRDDVSEDSVAEALLGPRSQTLNSAAAAEKPRTHLLKTWKNSLSKSASKVRDSAKAVFSSSARQASRSSTEPNGDAFEPTISRSPSLSRSPKSRVTNFAPRKRTAPLGGDAIDRLKRPRSGFKTSHFRLRAMGMIHMPNGQYLHESIAKPMLEGKRFPGIGDYGLPPVENGDSTEEDPAASELLGLKQSRQHFAARRASLASKESINSIIRNTGNGGSMSSPPHKRKRTTEGQGDDVASVVSVESEGSSPSSIKKQKKCDISETERIIQEMREIAALMEEGESWYREQSALLERGETPWS